MRASLKIEAIGDNSYQYMRLYTRILNSGVSGFGDSIGAPKMNYWVARIIGKDPLFGYCREFLRGKKDYKKSNSIGSRGIFIYYFLESGYVYEVSKPLTWNKTRRYFCTVTEDGNIIEIDRSFVNQWVNDHSVSMSLRQPRNE